MTTYPLDVLTAELTAFNTFDELINSSEGYNPSIYPTSERHVALANAFDAAMVGRGSKRRAFRGSAARDAVTLNGNHVAELMDFLQQHEDEITEGDWHDVEAVLAQLQQHYERRRR